jgi:hypothetical protein
MRVTEESDADVYIEILRQRARKNLPVPGRRPRGRPRRLDSRTVTNSA